MDPTHDSKGELKKFNSGKRFKPRGRRQKDTQRQQPTASPLNKPSHLHDQMQKELARHCRSPNDRRQEDLLPDLGEDDSDMSFSQAIQARARDIDDDPQMAQIYWYGRGYYESDTQALLNCTW